jgi:hypothetical protein
MFSPQSSLLDTEEKQPHVLHPTEGSKNLLK